MKTAVETDAVVCVFLVLQIRLMMREAEGRGGVVGRARLS
jgi:hypothetical protein